jgi:hypothetical protein
MSSDVMAIGKGDGTETGQVVSRVMVIEPRGFLAALIVDRLNSRPGVEKIVLPKNVGFGLATELAAGSIDTVVYSPLKARSRDFLPDRAEAEVVLRACAEARVRKVVLLSSAAAYGPDYHNPGLIREDRPAAARCPNRVAEAWRAVEAIAWRFLRQNERTCLTILRPALTLIPEASDWANRLFRRRWAVTVAGYNPSIQLLDSTDLAEAVSRSVAHDAAGVFNIAPDGVVPLRHALGAAGVLKIPLPWTPQWLARAALHRLGWASSDAQQDYLRYSWTISNQRSKLELGMRYAASTLDCARTARSQPATIPEEPGVPQHFDDFGMDVHFIHVRSRRALGFMARRYWRIEMRGLEHIPREGGPCWSAFTEGSCRSTAS